MRSRGDALQTLTATCHTRLLWTTAAGASIDTTACVGNSSIMIWGPSKRVRQEKEEKARHYRRVKHDELLTNLAAMSEAQAANWLAQNRLAGGEKMVDAWGRLVDIDDVVSESRGYVPRYRHEWDAEGIAREERLRVEKAKQEEGKLARKRAEESEIRSAQNRARELRNRYRAAAGLPPEDEE